MRFQVGDIVRISKDSEFYGTCEADHPKDINGEIVRIDQWDECTRVNWLTGGWEYYQEDELRLVRRPSTRVVDRFLEELTRRENES